MDAARGVMSPTPAPGPFRCLGCRAYVIGTDAGHCPRCGFVPPRALMVLPAEITRSRRVTSALVLGGALAIGATWYVVSL